MHAHQLWGANIFADYDWVGGWYLPLLGAWYLGTDLMLLRLQLRYCCRRYRWCTCAALAAGLALRLRIALRCCTLRTASSHLLVTLAAIINHQRPSPAGTDCPCLRSHRLLESSGQQLQPPPQCSAQEQGPALFLCRARRP